MISEGIQMIVYSILNLLSLYTLDSAILMFLERKKNYNIIYRVIPYFIYFIIGVFTYFWTDIPYINTLLSIILAFFVSLNFEGEFKRKITIAFLWTLFKYVIEFVVSVIYANILNVSYNEMIHNDLLKIIGNSYIVIISIIIIKIAQLIVRRKSRIEELTSTRRKARRRRKRSKRNS